MPCTCYSSTRIPSRLLANATNIQQYVFLHFFTKKKYRVRIESVVHTSTPCSSSIGGRSPSNNDGSSRRPSDDITASAPVASSNRSASALVSTPPLAMTGMATARLTFPIMSQLATPWTVFAWRTVRPCTAVVDVGRVSTVQCVTRSVRGGGSGMMIFGQAWQKICCKNGYYTTRACRFCRSVGRLQSGAGKADATSGNRSARMTPRQL